MHLSIFSLREGLKKTYWGKLWSFAKPPSDEEFIASLPFVHTGIVEMICRKPVGNSDFFLGLIMAGKGVLR